MNPKLQAIIDQLDKLGLDKAVAALKGLSPTNPTERMLLSAAIEYVGRYGLQGFAIIEGLILDRLNGKPAADIILTDLQAASELIAALEVKEEDGKKAITDALAQIGAAFGAVLHGLIGSAL